MPKTRNTRNAAADEDEVSLWQRPLIWAGNCLLARPRDSLLTIGAATAVGAIVINSLYLQPGPHPAPMFAMKTAPAIVSAATGTVTNPMPRERPAEASQVDARFPPPVISPQPQIQNTQPRPQPAAITHRDRDPIAELLASPQRPPATVVASNRAAVPVPPASIPVVSGPGLSSIQRRLTEFGYGPVKANGVDGPETRAAIERFERARGMPATGRVSERLKSELVSATGPL